MEIFFDSLIIIGVGLFSRYLFQSHQKSDHWGVYSLILRQKRARWINYEVKNSVVSGYYGYPAFVYWCVSLFPEKYWIPVLNFINYFSDVLVGLGLYFFCKSWFLSTSSFFDLPLMLSLAFLLSPLLHPLNARLLAPNSRGIGLMLVTAYCWSLFELLQGSFFLIWLCIGTCLCIFVVLTSQFAMQFILAVSVGLAFIYGNITVATPAILTFFIGMLIPSLKINQTLIAKMNHWRWYIKQVKIGGTTANDRLNLWQFRIPKSFKSLMALLSMNSPMFISFFSITVLYFVLFGIFYDRITLSFILAQPVLNFMINLLGITIALFILTSLKPFLFLGQSDRYFEYVLSILYFIFGYLIYSEVYSPYILILLILFQVIMIVLHLHFWGYPFKENDNLNDTDEIRSILSHVLNQTQQSRIALMPIKLAFRFNDIYHEFFESKGEIFFYFRSIVAEGDKSFDHFREDTITQDDFFLSISELKEKYSLSHFILLTSKQYTQNPLVDSLKNKEPAFKTHHYLLYKL